MKKMFDNPEKSRVVIIGTGAMACLFGTKIAPYVNKLTLIGTWAEGVKALQKDGIHFIEEGVETKTPVQSFQNPEKLKSDIVLVLVKSYQTPRAAKWAAKILGSNGLAVTLQNGLGNIEQLRSVLGSKRTALGDRKSVV